MKVERKARVAEAVRCRRGDAGWITHEGVVGRDRNIVAGEGAAGEAMRVVEYGAFWGRDLPGDLNSLLRLALRELGLQATATRGILEIVQKRRDSLPELVLGVTVAVINLEERSASVL